MTNAAPANPESLLLGAAEWAMIVVSLGLSARFVVAAILERTLLEALRNHPPSVPLLVEKIAQRQPWADNLFAVVLIAVAAGLGLLTVGDDASTRLDRLQFSVAFAIAGSAVLLHTLRRRERIGAWLADYPDLGSTWDGDASWSEAILMFVAVAIVVIYMVLTLADYWQDYPLIVVASLLVAAAIVVIVRYRRRRS